MLPKISSNFDGDGGGGRGRGQDCSQRKWEMHFWKTEKHIHHILLWKFWNLFYLLSYQIHPTRNWTGRLPQAWMDNPRKAREKERSRGAFLRGLKRTTSHDGKGQYFGGNQGRLRVSTRGAGSSHIRWKIKGSGISAHKGSGNMDLPSSHSRTQPSKCCAKYKVATG